VTALGPVLAAWAEQSPAPGRISVLCGEDPDGRVADAVRRLLAETSPPVPVTVSSAAENVGFAGGHNQLMAGAFSGGAAAVVVANPDLVPEPGALAALAGATVPAVSLRGPTLLLACAGTYAPEGTIDSAGIRWTRTGRHLDARQGEPASDLPGRPYRVPGISGACLFVPRAAYERIIDGSGEFFDASFLAYREDAELGLRADRLGVSSWIVPQALALHVRGVRGTARRGVSAHVNRLGVRNRFLIAFKYGTQRPGGWLGAPLRDAVVLAGVVVHERSSWPGVVDAWRLRGLMRAKGRRVRRSAVDSRLHPPLGAVERHG
jgi:GT2 family glycosyltransferase